MITPQQLRDLADTYCAIGVENVYIYTPDGPMQYRLEPDEAMREAASELERLTKMMDEMEIDCAGHCAQITELQRQNATFREAQKACEDCETVTEATLRIRADKTEADGARLREAARNVLSTIYITSFDGTCSAADALDKLRAAVTPPVEPPRGV